MTICFWNNRQPDLGWMRRLQQVLGRKHQRNLHVCNINDLPLTRKHIVNFGSDCPMCSCRQYMFFTLLFTWRLPFLHCNCWWTMWYVWNCFSLKPIISFTQKEGGKNFFWRLTVSEFVLETNCTLQVWKKVVYVDRLLQLFRYVPREQLTIPDFVFQWVFPFLVPQWFYFTFYVLHAIFFQWIVLMIEVEITKIDSRIAIMRLMQAWFGSEWGKGSYCGP